MRDEIEEQVEASAAEAASAAGPTGQSEPADPPTGLEEPLERADPAELVRELLEEIATAYDLDATVDVSQDDETVRGELVGEDLGLVIGRHGQTIDAIEHLAMRLAYPGGARGDRKRIVIDAAGYRARRADILEREADKAAADAIRYGRAVALDAMGAQERRLVHEYLRDRHDVETHSEGDEPDRHLVVSPVAGGLTD